MRRLRVLVLVTGMLAVAACGDDADDEPVAAVTTTTEAEADAEETTTTTEAPEPELEGTITVFAAASLTDAFTEIAADFEAENPGVTVELSFGPSSGLREQVLAGAPADLYASADVSNMTQVVEGGGAADPETFATNRLQLAVPSGNPGGVTALADLATEDLLVGLCAVEVPCGRLGREVLTNAGVTPSLDTEEPDVRSLLTKLQNDELDVGIVYETDVLSAEGEVEGIDIPDDVNAIAEYQIAVLTESPDPDLAGALLDFILADEGSSVLEMAGFGAP